MNILYIAAALRKAQYELLDDSEGSYGSIPGLAGVWAQGPALEECREALQSALEDWLVFTSIAAAGHLRYTVR